MHAMIPHYTPEEFRLRGETIYERVIKPRLTSADEGKFCAIDIDSEDFEIDPNELAAWYRLRGRHPEAQTWFMRVGFPTLRRIGSGAHQEFQADR